MSWLHVRPRPSPFALRCATISVRPMRRGRSHPPSPRPPPVLSKPRSQELRRTGAASDSSMISDGRSSGPDKKEVGAARAAGRSSSSLDESPMTAPPRGVGLTANRRSEVDQTCSSLKAAEPSRVNAKPAGYR